MIGKHVIVTTGFRGVFFGKLAAYNKGARRCTLTGARNIIYWSGKRGFLGIAAHGPEGGSVLGSTAPAIELHKITSVAECTPTATKALSEWTTP